MKACVADAFVPFSKPLEGVVPFLYCDQLGLVTCGMGNLVDPLDVHQLLGLFTRADGTEATPDDISADWRRVKARQDLKLHCGMAYASVALLRMSEDGIERIVHTKLSEDEEYLKGRFPAWDTWPADAQLATLSMAWACGPGFHYPKMAAALGAGDFTGAAQECLINPNIGTIVERNRRNKALYLAAADPCVDVEALTGGIWS